MSETGTTLILTGEPQPCKYCGEDTRDGMSFSGSNWRNMEDGEQAHAVCWIENVVDGAVDKRLREREDAIRK